MNETINELTKAKIPCKETGIMIRHTMCDICTPGPQCGIDAYVKNGKVIKVEGTDGFPTNQGALCTKGAANRQYIYRKDRIRQPMKRVGARGENRFQPISWEEAIAEIARNLNRIKSEWGPEAVGFLSGYPKWYRPWLHRLAYSFGSPNYMTESSVCHTAEVMSWKLTYGTEMRFDIMGGTDLLIGWGTNPLVSAYPMGRTYYSFKQKGGKIVIIDPRRTPTAIQCADLFLQPKSGTDGYLALALANCLIRDGRVDMHFIQEHVQGFEAFREMVHDYSVEKAESITGIPAKDIMALVEMLEKSKCPLVQPSNGLVHHINGVQTHRSVIALNALLGSVGKPGTIFPSGVTWVEMSAGFKTHQDEFVEERKPSGCRPRVGSSRFPVWEEMVEEAQTMDLMRQICTEQPYPIKGLYCHGVNTRMFIDTGSFVDALKKLDFITATDLFWTDFCNYADIVLPCCSSFERSEVKCYGGGWINYTSPAIEPLYESRDDVAIIADVAKALSLDDPLLKSGYDKCVKHIFRDVDIDLDYVKEKTLPVQISCPPEKDCFEQIRTPSGKIELYSNILEKYSESHFINPLPEWKRGDDWVNAEEYPMTLITGGRIPNAVHSRLHEVPWLRSLRPEPMADISPEDAKKMQIRQGDLICIESANGCICVKANITTISNPGEVNMFHGYKEANVNLLIPADMLDPISGFPGFKQVHCRIKKCEEG